jgi:hypothetical protein
MTHADLPPIVSNWHRGKALWSRAPKDIAMLQDANTTDQGDGHILHPSSRLLFRHWEKLRAERPCPSREEFDLHPIKLLMPDLVVIERDHLRASFRYRLSGSRVCALFCANVTTTNVLEGWDTFESDVVSRHLLTVINQKQPAVIRMRLTTDRNQMVAAEMLALPVQMRSSSQIQIMGGMFPFRPAQTLGHTGIVYRELVSARVIWTEHSESEDNVEPLPIEIRPQPGKPLFTLIDGGKA